MKNPFCHILVVLSKIIAPPLSFDPTPRRAPPVVFRCQSPVQRNPRVIDSRLTHGFPPPRLHSLLFQNIQSRYGACWPGRAEVPSDVPLLGNGNVKKISLLGSTGSIGTQTLDIAEEHPDKFEIVALSAVSASCHHPPGFFLSIGCTRECDVIGEVVSEKRARTPRLRPPPYPSLPADGRVPFFHFFFFTCCSLRCLLSQISNTFLCTRVELPVYQQAHHLYRTSTL